jgi:hypothetical protein
MKYILKTLTLLTAFASHTWAVDYPKMATMTEVQHAVEEALKTTDPRDILVIFDIDSTLIMSKDPALQRANIIKYNSTLKNHLQTISHNAQTIALNLCTQKPSQLVDVHTPKVIEQMKSKGIKVIACTAASPGKFKDIQCAERERFETLKKNGVDFSSAFPEHTDLPLVNVKGFLGRHPVFYQGVLCSAGEKDQCRKGASIVEFLQTTHYSPKVIVFIDDNKNYLKDLHEALRIHYPSVQFKGIEFTGELNYPAFPITEAQFVAYWKTLAMEAMLEEKIALPA